MAQKTKAAMQGRQCSTENKEQKQDTRPVAGGQRMSQRNFAPSEFIQFCTLGTAALARLRGGQAHRVNNFYSVLRVTKSHAHLQTTQKLGCLGCAALQHTPYLNCSRGCEPVAHTLLLHTSFRVAQLQLGTSSQNWGNPDFGYRTYTKNADRTPELESAQLFCINFSHAGRSKSFSLLPHVFDVLKHDFNMKAAIIKATAIHSIFFIAYPFGSMPRCCISFLTIRFNQADRVASPSSFIATIMASSKAGSTRKAICLLPLGIFMFDMCLTLGVIFVVSINVHHVSDTCKARSPAVLPALTGPLTKQLFEVTVMADQQHTQTHPKFTWRFLALNRHDIKAKPRRLSVEAATEREARRILAPHFILSLAARLLIQEVRDA